MFGRLFPRQFDNNFRGHWFALWLLVPILLLKAIIGINSILFTRRIASTADGIPLDTFGPAAARAAISLFGLLGMYQLLLALLGVVALLRYRAMIPFVYLFLLIQMLGNRGVSLLRPMAETNSAAAGSAISLGLLAATVLGLVLSLLDTKRDRPAG